MYLSSFEKYLKKIAKFEEVTHSFRYHSEPLDVPYSKNEKSVEDFFFIRVGILIGL